MVFNFRYWLSVIVFTLFSAIVFGQAAVDSAARDYDYKLPIILKSYNIARQKITAEFPKIDERMFAVADSALRYSQNDLFSYNKRILYANTLLRFINIIYNNASDEDMEKGRFNDGFKYFPLVMEWDNAGVISQNLKLYRKFTLAYSSLIPNDADAEEFIVNYARENPTEVLRYAAQFGQRSFAATVIDSMAITAPDLVKKYLSSENAVSYHIVRSKSPVSKYLLSVYRTYGQRSQAYILAYNVLKKEMTMEEADSLGDFPQDIFKVLVATMKKPDAYSKHSIYQLLDHYAIEQVRNANNISTTGSGYIVAEYFKNLNADDLFTIMIYGHKELSVQSLSNMISAVKRKIYSPFPYSFISSINDNRLRQFLAFAERNEKLDMILQFMDAKSINHLYTLMSQDESPSFDPDLSVTDSMDVQTLLRSRISESALEIRQQRSPRSETDNDPRPVSAQKYLDEFNITPSEKATEQHQPTITAEAQPPVDIAETQPADVSEPIIAPISLRLTENEKTILELKKNITGTLQQIPKFINEPFAEEILMYAAQTEPDEIFKRFDAYKAKFFATKILETAGCNAPTSLKRYIYNASHQIPMLLSKSTDTVIQAILKMPRVAGYQSKSYVLMDAIVKNRMTVSQADNICNSPQCMFKELAAICTQKNYIGKYSVERELTDFCLRFLREINDNIAYNEADAFNAIEGFSATEIYFLMVFGREEVVTSSFNGLYTRLQRKMKGENISSLLKKVEYNRFRTFISMCAAYGKLEPMLSELPIAERDTLLLNFVRNIAAAESNTEGVEIAETLNNIRDKQLLAVLHTEVKNQFLIADKDSNNLTIALYGVLASLIDGNAVVDVTWFDRLSKQIRIPALNQMPINTLLGEQNKCVQQMYFYNDADGRDSYNNFLNTFKILPTWKIEDKGTYVVIKSVEGNAVEIYANKPEYETNGQDAVTEYLRLNNTTPNVIIHRGHSFHTASTLQHVDSKIKLLLVGSCGGFYKLSNAIDNAPEAHIIATKQIGTKTVNDPILLSLVESIRTGKNIVWKDFWEMMKQKIGSNPHFTDYIPPHQNLKSLFSKAYFSILGV